jgi:hypothetical protein
MGPKHYLNDPGERDADGVAQSRGTALYSRSTEKAQIKGTVTFGVANFVYAPGYVLSIPLGGALIDPPGRRYLPPLPHGGLPHDVALGAAWGLKASD